MIHEDDLRRLLAEAAESVPPPGGAPESLLAALAEQTPPRARPRPARLRLVAVAAATLVVVAFGAALATSSDDDSATFTATGAAIGGGSGAGSSNTTIASAGDGTKHLLDEASGLQEFSGLGAPTDAASSALGDRDLAAPDLAPANPVQAGPGVDSAKIVKTGSLDLEVREGAFDGTVARISTQTIGLGGYIAESTTSESSDRPSGSIVVRVPSESFESLLSAVRKLGDVKAVSSKGTDVTAQFTDLAARLTALTATRDRLSTVLSEANNVPDILAVQDRITAVQVEIEQIQGQQRLLDDQTSFATLAITVGEPGSEIIELQSRNDGLGHAWDDARRRFGDSLERLVSWSGSAAVVLIVGLLLLVISRIVWLGVRRRMV